MDLAPADLLNGIGTVGVVLVVFWGLMTGRICTGRELREKNKRIDLLEQTLQTRDEQLGLVLGETMTVISPVLKAMRGAAAAAQVEETE